MSSGRVAPFVVRVEVVAMSLKFLSQFTLASMKITSEAICRARKLYHNTWEVRVESARTTEDVRSIEVPNKASLCHSN